MPKRTKTLAVLSVGAVALASTAYAIGSTTGNGSANAANTPSKKSGNTRPQIKTSADDPWVKTLAGKLGVDPSKLADALDSARDAQQPPSKDDMLQKAADALGVKKADLQKALEKLRPTPPDPPNGNNMPTPPAQPKLGPGGPRLHFRGGRGGPGGPHRAFGFGFGGPGGISDQFASDLAKALGIDKSKVTAAFDKLRDDAQAEQQSHWDAYVKALADKLGLPVEKVQQGLGSVPPRGIGVFVHP